MSREALLALVRDRLGLDPATLGERVLDDACAEARRHFGVGDDVALYRRVLLDADAFAECAESFTVPESWFFRAGEQFADLVRFAREQKTRRPLRVLCLPSAAGEEAWSTAISLLEAGFAPGAIDVLGIDVSRAAVRRAQDGIYRRSAFRGQPPPSAWLHPTGDGLFQVDPLLRRCVRFRVGNALDPLLLQAEEPFAAAFCRNLLIYLHGAARKQLLQTLLAALAPPALVLAGQAEVLSGIDDRLSPWPGGSPLTFRFGGETKAAPAPAFGGKWPATAEVPAAPLWEGLQARAKSGTEKRSGLKALPQKSEAEVAGLKALPRDAAEDPIQLAHRHADAGRVAEARIACLAHLAAFPEDVAALYLLGLLESAAGDTDAADRAFTRVLYVDREHLAALEQRIGLAERRGAATQAAALRARAARMRQRLGQRETPT